MNKVENNIHEQVFEAVQDFVLKREKRMQDEQQKAAEEAFKGEEHLRQHWTLTQLHIVSVINDSEALVNNAYLAEAASRFKSGHHKSDKRFDEALDD